MSPSSGCLSRTSVNEVCMCQHSNGAQVESGRVEHVRLEGNKVDGRPQIWVYNQCLQRFGSRHTWMAFVDADECGLLPCIRF